jgi:hypothetical protein
LIDDSKVAGSKAFDWNKEFSDIIENGGFDVIVGNPPYVRQELLGPFKPYLEDNYKVFAGTTDLFAYFYEKAIQLLKPDGLMSYISNTFSKTTGAGEVLRDYLIENSSFEQFVDFGTLVVFEGATTYPIILVLRKSDDRERFRYLEVAKDDLRSIDSAFHMKAFDVNQTSLKREGWVFESESSGQLRNKLLSHKSVKAQYGKSYRGILTGFNEAFIIDEVKRKELLAKDSRSSEVIKPFWEGKDIQRWTSNLKDKFIIFTRRGVDIDNYPAIKSHLEEYKIQLTPRNTPEVKVGRKPGPYEWYEIQDVVAYYELFEKPKITWPNLQAKGKFCYDDSGKYINAPAVILATGDKALLAILNSKVVWFFLKGVCVVRSGGYLEVKPQYFEQIPVPIIEKNIKDKLEPLVDQIIDVTQKLEDTSNRFNALVMSEFELEKWPANLGNWWNLDFDPLLKKLKLKLSLQQKDEFYSLYQKYQEECLENKTEIVRLENEIDQLAYEVYKLTSEEIRLLE